MEQTSSEIRILYVITSGILGGAQTHLCSLIEHLPSNFKVSIAMGEKGFLWEVFAQSDVKLHYIPSLVRPISPLNDLCAVYNLRQIILEIKPDLLALHSSKAGFLGRIVGKLCNIPVVFTAHGWSFTDGISPGKRAIYQYLERKVAKWTEKIICVSEYDRLLALDVMPAEAHKIVAIHNGISDLELQRKEDNKKSDGVKCIMVARFSEQKDHRLLLRALAELKMKNIFIQTTLVGEGPLLTAAKEMAIRLGIEEQICFSGTRFDIDQILEQHDIFILTSNWEGFPISILEAMRAGLPVIASDVGGVNEAVQDFITGYLIPRGDLHLLIQRLEALWQDKDLRIKLGGNGRRLFEEKFTVQQMLDKTIACYWAALEDRAK